MTNNKDRDMELLQSYCDKERDTLVKLVKNIESEEGREEFTDYIDGNFGIWVSVHLQRKEYRSCTICTCLGGPSIYIDTDAGEVKGYWGGKEASSPLPVGVVDEIDTYIEELWQYSA